MQKIFISQYPISTSKEKDLQMASAAAETYHYRSTTENSQVLEDANSIYNETWDRREPVDEALEKIRQAEDRATRVMYLAGKAEPLGAYTYRRELTDKFAEHGLKACFELKTFSAPKLEPAHPHADDMMNAAMEKARHLGAKSICVICKQESNGSQVFFKHAGFKEITNFAKSNEVLLGLSLADRKRRRIESDERLNEPSEKRQREASGSSSARPFNSPPFPAPNSDRRASVDLSRPDPRARYDGFRPREARAERRPSFVPAPKGCTLMKKYIHLIRDGKKTIEGRIDNGMFKNWRVGDQIRFFYMANAQDDVVCRITKIVRYNSFAEMVNKEDYKKCIPDAYSLENAIEIYDKIPGYKEKARTFGVLAVHLEKVK